MDYTNRREDLVVALSKAMDETGKTIHSVLPHGLSLIEAYHVSRLVISAEKKLSQAMRIVAPITELEQR